jgi:hypothetical protein
MGMVTMTITALAALLCGTLKLQIALMSQVTLQSQNLCQYGMYFKFRKRCDKCQKAQ